MTYFLIDSKRSVISYSMAAEFKYISMFFVCLLTLQAALARLIASWCRKKNYLSVFLTAFSMRLTGFYFAQFGSLCKRVFPGLDCKEKLKKKMFSMQYMKKALRTLPYSAPTRASKLSFNADLL